MKLWENAFQTIPDISFFDAENQKEMLNFEWPFTPRIWLHSASNFGKTRFRRFPTFHFPVPDFFFRICPVSKLPKNVVGKFLLASKKRKLQIVWNAFSQSLRPIGAMFEEQTVVQCSTLYAVVPLCAKLTYKNTDIHTVVYRHARTFADVYEQCFGAFLIVQTWKLVYME